MKTESISKITKALTVPKIKVMVDGEELTVCGISVSERKFICEKKCGRIFLFGHGEFQSATIETIKKETLT